MAILGIFSWSNNSKAFIYQRKYPAEATNQSHWVECQAWAHNRNCRWYEREQYSDPNFYHSSAYSSPHTEYHIAMRASALNYSNPVEDHSDRTWRGVLLYRRTTVPMTRKSRLPYFRKEKATHLSDLNSLKKWISAFRNKYSTSDRLKYNFHSY